MRDLVTGATLAFQDDDDPAKQTAEQASWKQIADNYWTEQCKISEEGKKRPKLYRTKAYEWLCLDLPIHVLI